MMYNASVNSKIKTVKQKSKKKKQQHLVAAHKHTGHRLPRQNTSWAFLIFIFLVVGVLLIGLTASAQAAFLTINATVKGTPPTEPAVITTPANNSTVSEIPIEVAGTCPAD